jgi:hypothetical protein
MGLFGFRFGSGKPDRSSSGKARTSKTSAAGPSSDPTRHHKPRKESRYTVPIFSIQIRAECFLGDKRYVGNLWDVSQYGACIRSVEPIPGRGRVRICLHDHGTNDMVERMATMKWAEYVMNAHYAGLTFDEPLDDDCGFLRTLLQLPTNPPVGRLSKLGPIRLNPWPL